MMDWNDIDKAADEATEAQTYLKPGQHKLVCAELSYKQHKGKDSYYFTAVVAQSDMHAPGEIVSISPMKPNPAQAQYDSYAKRDAKTMRELVCALWRIDESQFRQHVEQSFNPSQPVRGATVMVQATARKQDDKGRVFCDYTFFSAGEQSSENLAAMRAKVEELPRFRPKVGAQNAQWGQQQTQQAPAQTAPPPVVSAPPPPPMQQPPAAAQPPPGPPPQTNPQGGNNGWG